jgi:hypothetical protein
MVHFIGNLILILHSINSGTAYFKELMRRSGPISCFAPTPTTPHPNSPATHSCIKSKLKKKTDIESY